MEIQLLTLLQCVIYHVIKLFNKEFTMYFQYLSMFFVLTDYLVFIFINLRTIFG